MVKVRVNLVCSGDISLESAHIPVSRPPAPSPTINLIDNINGNHWHQGVAPLKIPSVAPEKEINKSLLNLS